MCTPPRLRYAIKKYCLRFQQRVGRGNPCTLLAKLELRPSGVVGDWGEWGGVLGAKQSQVFGEGRGARVQLYKGSHRARRSWNWFIKKILHILIFNIFEMCRTVLSIKSSFMSTIRVYRRIHEARFWCWRCVEVLVLWARFNFERQLLRLQKIAFWAFNFWKCISIIHEMDEWWLSNLAR